eukprot:TRINITY_DN13893_c0_g1_i1.p1 TRINITY_DN13893_c0_g1~~TRINITY_DN13893_c0_g1_i1.p1  ORF type:complete len:1361 (+),score=242.90 TRINITY_DN13893_c0_g1_i1:164-4246(+)
MVAASDLQHPACLAHVTVHKPASARRIAFLSLFVALYAVAGKWCYETAGEPLALAEIENKAREAKKNATANASLSTEELLRELAEVQAIAEPEDGGNVTVGPTKPMPSPYLPNAWAVGLLFSVCTLNALFFLLGQWLTWFKACSMYAPSAEVSEDCYVHIRTHPHKGSDALCKFYRSKRSPHRLCFEFQRQRYEYIPPKEYDSERKENDDITGSGEERGYVRLMRCPVDLPVAAYHRSRGLEEEDILKGIEQFGKNTLTIATPRFLDLYKQQMMSPLVVFQFFTSILWMLDEYWQFVMFNMGMILMLESTTVFQRIKTFGTLNSMSSKPYRINVFRNKEWQEISSLELLPGDLISVKAASAKPSSAASAISGPPKMPQSPDASSDSKLASKEVLEENTGVVPCDCVLLHGDAVVNEATLTGESVPQMKDALQAAEGQHLDIDGQHRIHMMFSGTQIIAANGTDHRTSTTQTKIPADAKAFRVAPDGGCVCYVVRTGFNSSQGQMMQMIEYSQNQMTGNSKETGYALMVLLLFALISAGYVLKQGLEKKDYTTHELLIKCVIIITSTVPKQLPMQMAMAVNTALMGLMKCGVFCTEPFRVPLAGQVNVCVFDKTGTLTTDQLVPVGMVNPSGWRAVANNSRSCVLRKGETVTIDGVEARPELNGERGQVISTETKLEGRVEVELAEGKKVSLKRSNLIPCPRDKDQAASNGLSPMTDACSEALMVVAGCHSLVEVQGVGVTGDPIEVAALKGIDWRYEAKSSKSLPGTWPTTEKAIQNLLAEIQKIPVEDTQKKADSDKQVADARARVADAQARAKKSPVKSVKIQHRYHFSSKLQRMSVVAHVDREASPHGQVCLVKGSPEAIGNLMKLGATPEWYEQTYRELAENGLRVLALAYKWCDSTDSELNSKEAPQREWVESDLDFAGFLAFGCKTRTDSGTVLRAIKDADIAIGMLTGDAPLTALHVAREVSICSAESVHPCLLLELAPDKTLHWVRAIGTDRKPQPFKCPGVLELASTHDLMVTEAALEAGAELSSGKLWGEVHAIKVFARMSPQGKANVIRAMQEQNGSCVFMCGDGGNDVGALKQADVGIALLSGYGNTNVSDDGSTDRVSSEGGEKSAEEELNIQQKKLAKKQQAAQKLMQAEMKTMQAELQAKQKKDMMDRINEAADKGEAGFSSTMRIMKETTMELKAQMVERQKEIAAKHGNIYSNKDTAKLLKEELELEGGPTIVRPGDASVAAPFTSRSPSVRNMVDVLRQGRCTLLSALQNQQIMMLECIISAYTLSQLTLEGGRSSERQMMASSFLLMISGMAFTFATPIDSMSKTKPLSSLFHPAVFVSMFQSYFALSRVLAMAVSGLIGS